ncbi:MAG: class III signal peptide-containing protein [Candidatus Diapherotrites archaeon]|nr:class III signal peptide-containing protein [Candidatus Diapherotrites archaeon]
MKKAQASTEYLIILAVVIIVALIVVGVMGWFPSTSGSVKEQQSKTYWSTATPFSITDVKYSGTTLELSLQNKMQDKLELTGVTVAGTAGTVTDTNFTAGETKAITITGVPSCGTAGDPYSISLTFTYNNIDSGISNNTQTGTQEYIGKCS